MAEIALAAAISAAISAASYTLNYLLTPKPKPIERGRLQGDLQIQNSEYGGMIPLILGGDPASGGEGEGSGGVQYVGATAPVPGSQVTTPALQDGDYVLVALSGVVATTATDFTYDDNGFTLSDQQVADRSAAPTGYRTKILTLVYAGASGPQSYDFAASGGSSFKIECCVVRAQHASLYFWDEAAAQIDAASSDTLTLGALSASDADGFALITFVCSDTTPTAVAASGADSEKYDTGGHALYVRTGIATGAVASPVVTLSANATANAYSLLVKPAVAGTPAPAMEGGYGARVAGNVIYLSDVRKTETTTESGGKGGGGQKTVTIEYFVDFAVMFGEGELSLAALFADSDVLFDARAGATRSGLRDASVSPDADYDPSEPPDPEDATLTSNPSARGNGTLSDNGDGQFEATGGSNAGGEFDFRFYAGTETQPVDPLLEAAMGVGETPAYLGRSYVVFENFNVSTYGRIPNITAILANVNLRTAGEIINYLAERVDYDTDDLDTSDVDSIIVRGLPVVERTPPRAVAEVLGDAYGFDVVESGGAVACIVRGGAPTFTVAADDLGCVESGAGGDGGGDLWSQFDTALQLDETDLPRRVDVKAFDPARDNEQNAQGVVRVQTQSRKHETYEYALTLTAEEMRRLAARKMAASWKEGRQTCRFTLPYTYHDCKPGRVGTVNRPDGTSHRVRVTEINAFLPGVLEVAAHVERNNGAGGVSGGSADPYTQTQIVAGDTASGIEPGSGAARVPATSIFGAIDRILRAAERNDGVGGFYAAAASFGNGDWRGATLYRDRGAGFEPFAHFTERATMGVAVSTLAGTDLGSETIDVDLYGDMTPVTSATDPEIALDACVVISGDEIFQYKTATQIGGGVNRWRFSDLRNRGKLCSTAGMATHATGERFIVLNSALRFCPVEPTLKGVAVDYRLVTTGANLNDAATCAFTADLPDFDVTTPADFNMTSPTGGEILATWTPVAAGSCKVTDGIVYEIRLTTTGGTLLFEGNASEYRKTGLAAATYVWQFRVKTKYSTGAWVSDSQAVAAAAGVGVTTTDGDDARAGAATAVTTLKVRGGRFDQTAAGESTLSRLVARSQVEFVEQLYRSALATNPTAGELATADTALTAARFTPLAFVAEMKTQGVDIFTGAAYLARARSDAEFIEDLYEALFNGPSDAAGHAYHLARLATQGGTLTRAELVADFVGSDEYSLIVFGVYGYHPEDATLPGLATAQSVASDAHTASGAWETIASMEVDVTVPEDTTASLVCDLSVDFSAALANACRLGFSLDGADPDEYYLRRDSTHIHVVIPSVAAGAHTVTAKWHDDGAGDDATFLRRRMTVTLGQPASSGHLLLETGGDILLETGGTFELE